MNSIECELKVGDEIWMPIPSGEDGSYGKIENLHNDDVIILVEHNYRRISVARSKIYYADAPGRWTLHPERRTTLTDGAQVYPSHREDRGDGQQKGYVVLSEEERAKGFVRPVRHSYKHLKCRSITTMGRTLAETYARDPKFYSGTFCCACGTHSPVGENGEFVWQGTDEKVGT